MVKEAADVLKDVLALSADEREKLMRLLAMRPDTGWATPETEQAWMEEIERREQAYAEGKAELIPLDEVMRQARERLSQS